MLVIVFNSFRSSFSLLAAIMKLAASAGSVNASANASAAGTERAATRAALRRLAFVHADFVSFYAQPAMRGTFDAVASSFFLDATNDIVGSVRAIANALRQDGGVWVSFGPLKYHFDDSVHLSSDELRAMVEAFGFTVLEWGYHWTDYVTSFQADNSLQPERYRALRFVAVLGAPEDRG